MLATSSNESKCIPCLKRMCARQIEPQVNRAAKPIYRERQRRCKLIFKPIYHTGQREKPAKNGLAGAYDVNVGQRAKQNDRSSGNQGSAGTVHVSENLWRIALLGQRRELSRATINA